MSESQNDPFDGLTPEEKAELVNLAKRLHAEKAPIERAERPPGYSRCFGQIGKFIVYVVGNPLFAWSALAVKILLVPVDLNDLYCFYRPSVNSAYVAVQRAALDFEYGVRKPSELAPSDQYFVLDPIDQSLEVTTTTTTTTTTPPDETSDFDRGLIVVASTGVGSITPQGLPESLPTWLL